MPGCLKGFNPNSVARRGALIAALGFSVSALAHTPTPGQIVRFQPNMLRSQRPFIVKGHVNVGKSKLTTKIVWVDPGKYRLTIEKIPSSFYVEAPASEWTLIRDGRTCVIRTDRMNVNCPPASFWGQIELSGQADAAAASLIRPGFANRGDLVWKETDGKSLIENKDVSNDSRVRLNIGQNGNTPVAVLEIRGDNISSQTPGEEYPVIQFDQTFLAPLMARWLSDGDVVTLQASADLNTSRDQPRFSHVLASKIEVFTGKAPIATFVRQDPDKLERTPQLSPVPRATSDITALKSALSNEGQQLLRAVLLTH